MDVERVLSELRKERDAIEAAIFNLERVARPGNLGPRRLPDSAPRSRTSGVNGFHTNLAPEETRG
jgi:hypothetical protein